MKKGEPCGEFKIITGYQTEDETIWIEKEDVEEASASIGAVDDMHYTLDIGLTFLRIRLEEKLG